jgi:hypothetical protein
MKSMKPSVDNKAPPRFKHMRRNLKKEQMDEGEGGFRCGLVCAGCAWTG